MNADGVKRAFLKGPDKMFDEEPGDPHGECVVEIEKLQAMVADLQRELRALEEENTCLRERLNILESTPK